MKTEDISKLPPELRPIAELCAEVRDATRCACCSSPTIEKVMACGSAFCFHCLENRTRHDGCETCEARSAALPLALTWGLQVVEERDDLAYWKETAIKISPPLQDIGRELDLRLGDTIHDKILSGIQHLKHKLETAEATIATLTRELNSLITGLEPNGYPLWFNRAVHECKGCDPEDLCNGHYAMADRSWTGCEKEIEAFRAALSHTPEGGGQ